MNPSSIKLSFSIKIERNIFVRSESIIAHISLLNVGLEPIKVDDFTIKSNSLHFKAVNNLKDKFEGSLRSQLIRDGVRDFPIKGKDEVTLSPNGLKENDVDLINILGEMPEGEYKAISYYMIGDLSFLKSNAINFKIVSSNPRYSNTFQDYLRNDAIGINSVWINEEEDGRFYVFLMENSCNFPPNIISNKRLFNIDNLKEISFSVPSTDEQEVKYFVWNEKDAIYVATMIKDEFDKVRKIMTPVDQLILPALTTDDFDLKVLTLSKNGEESRINCVVVPFDKEPKTYGVHRFKGSFDKYSITFDGDDMFHFAYNVDGKICYIRANPKDLPDFKVKPIIFGESKEQVVNVHLFNSWLDEGNNYHVILEYAIKEANKMRSNIVDPERNIELSHLYIPIKVNELKLLQVILDYECNAYFLFHDRSGSLWFGSKDGGLLKITEEGERCPGNIDQPIMLISSYYSHMYGIYLRYVKNKSSFIFKDLKRF